LFIVDAAQFQYSGRASSLSAFRAPVLVGTIGKVSLLLCH
jgi:hypothetical protein